MNLWRILSLSWQNSIALPRFLWIFVFMTHLLESMTACLGMSNGPSLVELNMVLTAALFFFSTHLMVYTGVKRWAAASHPRQRPMTTSSAESLLADFTDFRGPLSASWVHRRLHVGAIILVACAYVLFTVRDLADWPFELLVCCAIVLSVLNTYLLLLLAINFTWGKILKGLRSTPTA
jgi:hypothetical protein